MLIFFALIFLFYFKEKTHKNNVMNKTEMFVENDTVCWMIYIDVEDNCTD